LAAAAAAVTVLLLASDPASSLGFRNADHLSWAPDFVRASRFQDPLVVESSGLAAGRKFPGVIWTQNDRRNATFLFAADYAGNPLGRFRVAATNHDWEDLAMDDQGRLYISDTGNNREKRDSLEVLRLEEPDIHAPPLETLAVERRWLLRLPGEDFNSEALFIYEGHAYLIAKVTRNKSAAVYRFSLDAPEQAPDMQSVCKIRLGSPVTAADISPDHLFLAVLALDGLRVYPVARNIEQTLKQTPRFLPITGHQVEGCAFVAEGIMVSAESGELILCPRQRYDR
jgi:hypothetical protein